MKETVYSSLSDLIDYTLWNQVKQINLFNILNSNTSYKTWNCQSGLKKGSNQCFFMHTSSFWYRGIFIFSLISIKFKNNDLLDHTCYSQHNIQFFSKGWTNCLLLFNLPGSNIPQKYNNLTLTQLWPLTSLSFSSVTSLWLSTCRCSDDVWLSSRNLPE